MNISNPVSSSIQKVSFSFYETQDIKNFSVKAITNPQIFDTLNHPTTGGLYDPCLGPHSKDTLCGTCQLDHKSCPGHFGHVDLTVPVYNPINFRLMYKLLQSTCHYCHHFRVSDLVTTLYAGKLRLIHAGLLVEASEMDSLIDVKPRKKNDDEEEEEDDQEDIAEGPKERILKQIDEYVTKALKNVDQKFIKTTLITQTLRKVERQYLSVISAQSCQNCHGYSPKFRTEGNVKIFEKPLNPKQKATMNARGLTRAKLFADAPTIDEKNLPDTDVYITPLTVKAHLELLWKKEQHVLDLLYGSNKKGVRTFSPNIFFLEVVAVTPSKFRPVSVVGDQMFEHPQNIYLSDIIKANIQIQDISQMEKSWSETNMDEDPKLKALKADDFLKRKVDGWIKLQESVNFLIDSDKAPAPPGKVAPPGVRQLLEKKEGLFRKHMMGKRVNYAARSVISPDPYIETNEIGIPPVFAKKLTYPEPVTPHNVKEMRTCVINGPEIWPGATHIQNEDGTLTSLGAFDQAGRTALANQLLTPSLQTGHAGTSHQFKNTNKKVYRHLRNGDFLLLNRQPTLHKPSIMAHTARVLPGERTIRMHYANCNTYNADFDGDEMNAHFPQNEIARAEAMIIARTDQQYLVPTDGGVLRGLIQDHVDAGVDMCSRDSFFKREEYIQLVYAGLRESNSAASIGNGNIETPIVFGVNGRLILQPPTILKPVPRWTGKQIISTILDNITPQDRSRLNLISKSRIPAKQWGPTAPEEQKVIIMDGDLLTGILDKSQFGASGNGLVHAVYEVYGPPYAGKLLSILGRLFTAYLQSVGFSCRMDDLLLTPQGDKKRRALIDSAQKIGYEASSEYVKQKNAKHIKLGLELVLRDSEKMAGLDSAMKTRTNKVTSEIISSCVPDMLYKPFPRNNMQVMTVSGAKGSSVNVSQISCLLGQQELEGKRVPTMVSGKTLPSFTAFDTSARSGGYITGRFLTGIKPQEYYFHCMAGREGLIDTAVKTSRSGYLQRCLIKHLEGIRVHYDQTVRDLDGSILQFHYGEDSLDVCKQTTLKKFDFNALNYHALISRYNPENIADKVEEDKVRKFIKKHKKKGIEHDPILSLFNPSKFIGAVSESFKSKLDEYVKKNPSKLIDDSTTDRQTWSCPLIEPDRFKMLMNLKYMHSLVEPGESVGLLAAQSIGEPSTQMTLNTFHFAGFGAKNVTLGIPRLREIIMTASSSIKTPLMRLPLKDNVSETKANELCEEISRLVLSQIMQNVTVTETLVPKSYSQPRSKLLKIKLEFWHQKHYKQQYNITVSKLAEILEKSFIPALERAISRDLKGRLRKDVNDIENVGVGVAEKSISSKNNDEDEQAGNKAVEEQSDSGEDTDDENDGDVASSKGKAKRKQQSTYEEDEEDQEKSDDDEEMANNTQDEQEDRIVDSSKYVSGFKFDKSTGQTCEISVKFPADTKKILMVALVESVCQNVVIHQVKDIQRCFPQPNESENDTSVNLGTEGCNLRGMWEYSDFIDINKVYTNDISAVLRTYGVEAARSAITQEIASVFGVYGIDVDPRHLSLIGDYMTFEGGYKPFNRMGMDSNTSPFTQMSYERTTHFLNTATLTGDFDPLDSPSARIAMGKVVKGGTGSFDVLQPLIQ
ncbi:hypothetical protein HDV04_004151 [Boothiomyces sp. JEL0838]|nr:hypothetical protein HDV04_004151 [Boothiomyces sp. JEL0838]